VTLEGRRRHRSKLLLFAAIAIGLPICEVGSFPIHGDQTVLPDGTELNEDSFEKPRELFRSEIAGGTKSYLVNLGDVAFNSPSILGPVAHRAGISCATCHVNGASNAQLFIPGLSTRHGSFDTTGALFNTKADDGKLNAVTIPSLRGSRSLSPYGHDGRIASLREFVRNVIVNEFAGPEPSAATLDAMVAYIQDIDFLPNDHVDARGRLTAKATSAERRGEKLFYKPFPHDRSLSCAGCHEPSAAFIDHRQHDVGSDGIFKTKTLLNANFNAPYFHDGRYDTYGQVVAHFNRVFGLGLNAANQSNLVAYLNAIGAGEHGMEPDSIDARLKEVNDFASVLAVAIPARDEDVIALVVATTGAELRELIEHFPDRKDITISGGIEQRGVARAVLKEAVLALRRIDIAAASNEFDRAGLEFQAFTKTMRDAPSILKAAENWSLFNASIHRARYSTLRQMSEAATSH